jgi:purine-binding chemotaxis protein CheW
VRQYGQLTAPNAAVTALVFRAGTLLCALPLGEVIETMRPLETRPLAGTAAFVRGISVLRGVPTPVIDVARLLTGAASESGPNAQSGANAQSGPNAESGAGGRLGGTGRIERYVAVGTEHGPVALATGTVLGIRDTEAGPAEAHPALLGGSHRLVAGVGTFGAEPLLLLQSMRAVPDEVWEAAAAADAR